MSTLAARFAGTRFLASAAAPGQLPPPDRPEVAFAGRSNAGKSSALNTICRERQLARVSRQPGRTQTLNFFDLPAHGRLVDLPGYGYAQAPAELRRGWGRLIGEYLESRESLRGLVVIMDARHPLKPLDEQLLAWARSLELPCHVVLTKSDKLTRAEARRTLAEVRSRLAAIAAESSVQIFSAQAGDGADELRGKILEWLAEPSAPEENPAP
jgi:GTP-binding protein